MALMFHLFYAVALFKKDFGVIDIAWGIGHLVPLCVGLIFNPVLSLRQILVSLILLLWACRLSGYIFLRSQKKPEDFRYNEMRRSYGNRANLLAYIRIFWFQTIILYVLSLPVLWIISIEQSDFVLSDYIALGVSLIGLTIETIADSQKNQFKKNKNNKEKFIQSGLWKYSRHPNYFGESLYWWGFFFFSFNLSLGGLPLWSVAWFSPLVLTLFLLFFSGIPMLEKKRENDKKFIEYKKRTSAFIPLPPRENV